MSPDGVHTAAYRWVPYLALRNIATRRMRSGASTYEASCRAGHAPTTTTERICDHSVVLDSPVSEAIDRLL